MNAKQNHKARTSEQAFRTQVPVQATNFCPAPENHGFKFQRTDLPGQPIIDADFRQCYRYKQEWNNNAAKRG